MKEFSQRCFFYHIRLVLIGLMIVQVPSPDHYCVDSGSKCPRCQRLYLWYFSFCRVCRCVVYPSILYTVYGLFL